MDNQLKPCPACGASVKITGGDSWHNQNEFWIVCEACHCVRVGDTEKEECIKRWNALPRHNDISHDKVDCAGCPERQYRQGLVWTKKEPMREGWYWWKCAGIIGIDFVKEGGKRVLNDKTALWAGPIPLPQEATR